MNVIVFLLTIACAAVLCLLVWRFIQPVLLRNIIVGIIVGLAVLWALRVLGFLDLGRLTVGG